MERENAKEDPQAEFESACQPTGVMTKNNYKRTKARDSEISFCVHKMKTCPRLSLRRDTGFLAFLFPRSLGSGVYDEINGGQ